MPAVVCNSCKHDGFENCDANDADKRTVVSSKDAGAVACTIVSNVAREKFDVQSYLTKGNIDGKDENGNHPT